jgi:hypothetical protein
METTEILMIIGALVVGFIWGWTARERAAVAKVNEMMKGAEEHVADNLIKIIIEPSNGCYYVYAVEDRTFMAQGKDRDELEDNLAKRYPGKMFAATPDNLKEIGFYNDTNSK